MTTTAARLGGLDASARAAALCKHCGNPVAVETDEFCCTGCESVWSLLHDQGLERYYDLGGGRGAPAAAATARADHKWLDAYDGACPARLTLDVQGIHCAACVWLFERVFSREAGGVSLVVNPTLGKLDIAAQPGFSVREFVGAIERFGYRVGPPLKRARRDDGLLARMGVCIAIAMNAMIFAFAIYAGLSDGPIYRMFTGIELGLGTLSVIVGGWVFFKSAWRGIRSGIVHLDVPIALGIALAYASSVYSHFAGSSRTYFDTLTVFIALMLVGRFLQERVIERNRRQILESDGAEGLLTRRIEPDASVRTVRCQEIAEGDRLLVAPGDLVPVDGDLEDARATISLDWIDGESSPHDVTRGAVIPAGAFNSGAIAFALRAKTDFDASPVRDLLRATREHPNDAARATPWWRRFAKVYVAGVLLIGAIGFLGWWLIGGDIHRALDVTAGVLIVTCPCAFGIATPMAYELVQAGLRRAGLFVRTNGFLDRAQSIARVVFDKTGTLTTGALKVRDPEALVALPDDERTMLYNLAARSAHPKSAAIAKALGGKARFVDGLDVHEEAGVGLRLEHDAHQWTLGGRGDAVAFSRDGAVVLEIALTEDLRVDAARELEALRALGYETWIVSGDAPERVKALATRVGVSEDRALGGCKPAQKAEFLSGHDASLMIGDGINDTLAVERAFCSGTPAIDRPFLPARTDFYFTTPGLRPVTLALRAARALRGVTRLNLAIAVLYNVLTVSLAYAGLLSPLVCAIVMPLSSLTVVGTTVASLSPRSSLWKS